MSSVELVSHLKVPIPVLDCIGAFLFALRADTAKYNDWYAEQKLW